LEEELLFAELLEDFALLEADFALLEEDFSELEEGATLLEEGGSAELDSMMGSALELDSILPCSGCFVNLSPGFRMGSSATFFTCVIVVTPSRPIRVPTV
jgi:hypothetical protein